MTSTVKITKGQVVNLKPEYMDKGDESLTFVAVETVELYDDIDTVIVEPLECTMFIKPHSRVSRYMIK